MRRAVHRLGDGLAHLLDLVHQRHLRVKASRRVDEQQVGAALPWPWWSRRRRRRPGSAPSLPLHDLGADALAPHLELLHRCGAEGVARREDAPSCRRRCSAWRACRWSSSCPTPLTPTMSTTVGLADARMAPPPMPEDARGLGAQRGPHRVGVFELVLGERLAQAVEDGLRGLRTDVAREHDLFHLLQDGRVDLFLALEERRETRNEPAARRGEALAEAGDVALGRGGAGGGGGGPCGSGAAASAGPAGGAGAAAPALAGGGLRSASAVAPWRARLSSRPASPARPARRAGGRSPGAAPAPRPRSEQKHDGRDDDERDDDGDGGHGRLPPQVAAAARL